MPDGGAAVRGHSGVVRLLNRALADEELQKRMRENCYKAAERYDLECIGQEWLALFGKL